MDIFVPNVPSHVTQKQVRASFEDPLKQYGIVDYHCEVFRPRGRALANITVLGTAAGQSFLRVYGVPQGSSFRACSQKSIVCGGQSLRCERSRNSPNEFSMKALIHEASQRAATAVAQHATNSHTNRGQAQNVRRFEITGVQCGAWDYEGANLVFKSHCSLDQKGTITFGTRSAILILGRDGGNQTRMDVEYVSCEHAVSGDSQSPTITFALSWSPKFYEIDGPANLAASLAGLDLGSLSAKQASAEKTRTLGLNTDHTKVAGALRVYRVQFSDDASKTSKTSKTSRANIDHVRRLLQSSPKMPPTISMATKTIHCRQLWGRSFVQLTNYLTDTRSYGYLPFQILYQIERLARNGTLPPEKVIDLLPTVKSLHRLNGTDAVSHALHRLNSIVPVPGPHVEARDLSIATLVDELVELAESLDEYSPDNPYQLTRRHQHINLIHRVVVTPTGLYLEGPDPEPTNRVLRKYADHTDNFVRVMFLDEDGSSVRYDPRASQEKVYHGRFKQILDGTILISGQGFSFLGFSHSSLRSQCCWFMAPIIRNDVLAYAPTILKELGSFENIRTPAKCAARIGQNFTDTNATVELRPYMKSQAATVSRNGREFSDGVGTISKDLLQKVWNVYGMRRMLKPTALQIRFQGAKGMVSLDTRLQGEQLLLRPSMTKFEAPHAWYLEICGAAFRPLPMILNRQFIKIMEDLGIGSETFIDLQKTAVDSLRCMTVDAVNTKTFLDGISLSKATRVPELISLLGLIGLDYHADKFLYGVVEMAVVTKLRDIKYRGMTLYGIMDETGILREGEIFVITEQPSSGPTHPFHVQAEHCGVSGKHVLVRDLVVITRSPAMHPGDIQLARAVNVPEHSPLQALRNVVVFSQHGQRDLPSQLSGGDLDGDLYNVIYDKRLLPPITYVAADYPRVKPVELDRDVTAKDMSDFFVKFMETDQLGMLCNLHQQLADRGSLGTLHPDCIKLAGMASTAVDFSKTGIPINLRECPRYERLRPDFMAPGPRVFVSDSGEIEFDEVDDQNDEAFEDLESERKPMRYYRSEKVLGQLYRNIDERQFLDDMQKHHHIAYQRSATKSSVLMQLCAYMKHHANRVRLEWEDQKDLARKIRAGYDDSLVDILYKFGPTPRMPLSETEAFSGTILGRQGGAQGKPLREMSNQLRDRFDTIAESTIMRIIHGDIPMEKIEYMNASIPEHGISAWPRAIACLVVALEETGVRDVRLGELESFRYIAAVIALQYFPMIGRSSLPRLMQDILVVR